MIRNLTLLSNMEMKKNEYAKTLLEISEMIRNSELKLQTHEYY
jgi:hypothetical protein